jgi:hypothetical protein
MSEAIRQATRDAHAPGREPELYGLMAEFATPDELLEAARAAHRAGYTRMDAYSPYPVEGLAEAIGFRQTRIPMVVLIGAIIGAVGGYFMQWFSSVHHYPMNIGGRPYNSWPAFIPITFECAILLAAAGAVFGMLALNGLPTPYHPLFNVPDFARASRDRFFLCIETTDPKFERQRVEAFLAGLNPMQIAEVPR